MQHLHIHHSSELDVLSARPYSAVRFINVFCFITGEVEDPPQHQIHPDIFSRAIFFIQTFPKLESVFIGGMINGKRELYHSYDEDYDLYEFHVGDDFADCLNVLKWHVDVSFAVGAVNTLRRSQQTYVGPRLGLVVVNVRSSSISSRSEIGSLQSENPWRHIQDSSPHLSHGCLQHHPPVATFRIIGSVWLLSSVGDGASSSADTSSP